MNLHFRQEREIIEYFSKNNQILLNNDIIFIIFMFIKVENEINPIQQQQYPVVTFANITDGQHRYFLQWYFAIIKLSL